MAALNVLFLFIGVSLTISYLLVAWSADRANQKANQPIAYVEYSTSNTEPWRWRQPNDHLRRKEPTNRHLQLSIADGVESSSLTVPQRSDLADGIVHILGYFLFGIGAFTSLSFLFQNIGSALICFIFCFGLGWICLEMGNRVVQIDLYRDRMTVITRHPLLKQRSYTYVRHPQLRITGKVQSMFKMSRGQIYPDYLLTVVQPRFSLFGNHETFHLACGITQGGWIVAGLQHWQSLSLS
jgi:hypothetical protein